jgi:hypothetical protein
MSIKLLVSKAKSVTTRWYRSSCSVCLVYYINGDSYMKVTWYKPCHIASYEGRGFRRHFYDAREDSYGTRPRIP